MKKYVFSVDGMMCGNCEKHAINAVKKAVSAKAVTASHLDKKVVVTAKKELDTNAIKTAIEDTGYTVLGFSEEE